MSAFFLLISFGCSNISVNKEKDSAGRVIRSVSYKDGVPDTITLIKYIGATDKPLSKENFEIKEGVTSHNWTENYIYYRGKVSIINFFIDCNEKKLKCGRIVYNYSGDQKTRVEFFSLLDVKGNSLFIHGLDLYTSPEKGLVTRRIIEYEQNPDTLVNMQVSQYVIKYIDNKVFSMQMYILDKESRRIINSQETNLKVIEKMIGTIEKRLKDQCKGYKIYKRIKYW